MKTITNPPQWYIDEVQALIPEARALIEQAKPVLDRFAQVWTELNKGSWTDTGETTELLDAAVEEHGMGELHTLLAELGGRFDQLNLAGVHPAERVRYGVPKLTSEDQPWMP